MSKNPSTYSCSQKMENKALKSQNINFISSLQGKINVQRILVNPIPLYKHQASSSPKYMQFLSFYTFKVIGDSSIIDLIFGGSLTGISLIISVGSSLFCSSSTFSHHVCGRSTYWQFCASINKQVSVFKHRMNQVSNKFPTFYVFFFFFLN